MTKAHIPHFCIAYIALTVMSTTSTCAQDVLWSVDCGESIGAFSPSIACDRDGSLLVLGRTGDASRGTDSAAVFRIQTDGRIVWDSTGILPSSVDEHSILAARDRGFFVLGTPTGGGLRVWRLNADHSLQGGQQYGDDRNAQSGGCARSTSDSGFVKCGVYRKDRTSLAEAIDVMRFGPTGGYQWHKQYPLQNVIVARSIRQHSSGSFFVTAWQSTRRNLVVLKIEPDGDLVWTKVIPGPGDITTDDVVEQSDGSLLVASTIRFAGRVVLYRMSSDNGDIIGDTVGHDIGGVVQIEPSGDGGFILLTRTDKTYLHKIRTDGTLAWTYVVPDFDHAKYVRMLPFAGFIAIAGAAGATGLRVAVLRESTSGIELIDASARTMDLR